jgi:hypothetical protein
VGVAVYLPLLAALLLGASARRLSRVLAPRTAALALTFAAVLVATSTSFVLGVLAFTLLGTLPPVAALGRWSVTALSAADPVPQLVAAVACAAVLLLGASGARAAVRRGRALAAARALCLTLGGEPGQLVILDDDADDVYALPGDRGRIVASRSLLAALPADERRALLAHETAHLRGRHHLYRSAAELAAAVNPMLRPVARAVRYATERWADEDAATATGDRASVARALARVGLRRHDAPAPVGWRAVALDGAESAVVARVRALLATPPRRRPGTLVAQAALASVLVMTVTSTVEAQRDAEHLFEQARPAVTASATVGTTALGR